LSEWFLLITNRGVHVSVPVLKTKAKELAKKMDNEQLIATDGWLSMWKNRYKMHFF